MAVDFAALKTELLTDPVSLGYSQFVNNGADNQLTELLNSKIRAGTRKVPLWEIKRHAILNGFWASVRLASANHASDAVKGAALSAIDFISDSRFETLDFDLEAVQIMVGALVSGSVMTVEQRDGLLALADVDISRAEELFGENTIISSNDISFALRGKR